MTAGVNVEVLFSTASFNKGRTESDSIGVELAEYSQVLERQNSLIMTDAEKQNITRLEAERKPGANGHFAHVDIRVTQSLVITIQTFMNRMH